MNRTFSQGFYQGMLVHQRATGRVDQDGGRLHLLELFLAEDMIGIGGIRGVQGYEIGFRQKLFLGIIYLILSRHIVQGVALGSVKG